MYTDHFGLTAPLVSDGIAREDQIFRGTQQLATATDLRLALGRGDAVAIVYGPAGTGKSTIAADALRESVTRLAIGCLTDPAQTPHELLEQLLIEFGFSPYKMSRTERLNHWRQCLGEMATTGTRVGIVVENTDLIGTDVLAELEALTARDIRGNAGANLLLTARAPIAGIESEPRLTALRQRCRAVVEVPPLTAEATGEYLRFRFALVGADWDSIAEPGLDSGIHAVAAGTIRLIDNIVESCLARAAYAGETRLSLALLEQVVAMLPGFGPAIVRSGESASESFAAEPAASEPDPGDSAEVAPAPLPVETTAVPEPVSALADPAAAAAPEPALPAEMPAAAIEPALPPEMPAAAIEPVLLPEKPAAASQPEPAQPAERSAAATEPEPALPPEMPPATTKPAQPALVETGAFAVPVPEAASPPEAETAAAPTSVVTPDDAPNPEHAARVDELELATDPARAGMPEIPVLDDAVEFVIAPQHSAEVDDHEQPLDGTIVDALLALPAERPDTSAAAPPQIPEPAAGSGEYGPQADELAASDESDGNDESDLTDEDRQQIEMLEAFANAEALEEISESMAETIFGDVLDSEVSDSLREAFDRLIGSADESATDPADDEQGPADRTHAAGH